VGEDNHRTPSQYSDYVHLLFSRQCLCDFDMFHGLTYDCHVFTIATTQPKPTYLAHEIWALCMVPSQDTTYSNLPISHHVLNVYGKYIKGIYVICEGEV
jgi:hypothetical protein